MSMTDIHFTTTSAKVFAPLLRLLYQSGFFFAPVFLSVMTIPAIALFIWVVKKIRRNRTLSATSRTIRIFWFSFYFYISWMALNSLAVGFKTMIVEELVYQERKWFEPYLPGIHFYITSACLAYLALIVNSRYRFIDLLLAIYLQVALIAGYATAGYRTFNEDRDGAIGGVLLLLFFAVCNYDLVKRVYKSRAWQLLPQPA
ncbi:MAG TPA: hypothetical protein VKN18_25665 [Blastocatellia bacterium]|nr:hypothetical protein [Blastocatellia bacterium]